MSDVNRKPVATDPADLDRAPRMYVDETRSLPEIAKELGWPISRVRSRLIGCGVTLRTRSQALKSKPNLNANLRGRKRGPMPAETKRKLSEARLKQPCAGVSLKPSGYIAHTNGPHKDRSVHAVIMEERLGRRLLPKEVVHHVDGDKTNNNIDNLALMTQSGHGRLHRMLDVVARKRGEDGRFS